MRKTLDKFKLSTDYGTMFVIDFDGNVRKLCSTEGLSPADSEMRYKQGFIWMPDSLLLDMPSETWSAFVEVCTATEVEVSQDAYRAIQVPFNVDSWEAMEAIMVSGPMPGDEHIVSLPQGHYALICEIGHKPYDRQYYQREYGQDLPREDYGQDLWERPLWCRLTFIPQETVQAAVLHQAPLLEGDSVDANLSPSYPVVLGIRPGQFTLTGEPIQP